MRSIRIIPIILLLILFVSNVSLAIITNPDPSSIRYLIFGAVYLMLGLLLLSKFRFAEWLGLLIPLTILFIYPLLLDFKSLHPWSSGILSAINAIVMVCCFILLLLKVKNS